VAETGNGVRVTWVECWYHSSSAQKIETGNDAERKIDQAAEWKNKECMLMIK